MNSIARWVGATVIAIWSPSFPQKSLANGFTGEEFLNWPIEGQNNYIGIAVTMASLIASRVNPGNGECLDTWYAARDAVAEERDAEIRATIARNSEFHPSAIIILVLEEACGSFSQ